MSAGTVLELRDVVKRYSGAGEEVRAVDGVSLTVDAGEMLCLHGPSGSGKTTLLLLIAKLIDPDAGSIRYRGADLASLSEAQSSQYLRREVGFVYQSAQLMPRVSALENASIKLLLDGISPRQARARAKPWLESLGMGERLNYTPEQLSGGERQRVAIARALVSEPALLLADEPTANLDSARSLQTVSLLAELAHEQGTGVVLVTHDSEAAALADRSLLLRDGRLVDGEPGEPSESGEPGEQPVSSAASGGGVLKRPSASAASGAAR